MRGSGGLLCDHVGIGRLHGRVAVTSASALLMSGAAQSTCATPTRSRVCAQNGVVVSLNMLSERLGGGKYARACLGPCKSHQMWVGGQNGLCGFSPCSRLARSICVNGALIEHLSSANRPAPHTGAPAVKALHDLGLRQSMAERLRSKN